jgi:hypothetical protein
VLNIEPGPESGGSIAVTPNNSVLFVGNSAYNNLDLLASTQSGSMISHFNMKGGYGI